MNARTGAGPQTTQLGPKWLGEKGAHKRHSFLPSRVLAATCSQLPTPVPIPVPRWSSWAHSHTVLQDSLGTKPVLIECPSDGRGHGTHSIDWLCGKETEEVAGARAACGHKGSRCTLRRLAGYPARGAVASQCVVLWTLMATVRSTVQVGGRRMRGSPIHVGRAGLSLGRGRKY
jgi:hypothetical protein